MNYTARTLSPTDNKTACAVVALFEPRQLSDAARRIDKASGGAITQAIRRGDAKAATGSALVLHDLTGIKAERVVVVGCGERDKLDAARFRRIVTGATDAVTATGATDVCFFLTAIEVAGHDLYWKTRQVVELSRERCYRFSAFKSSDDPGVKLKKATVAVRDERQRKAAAPAVSHALAIANGVDLARDLGNTPGNVCTPTYLAARAREMGRKHKALKVTVLGEAELKKLKMGSFLSVTAGSRQPAKFIVMEYYGTRRNTPPAVLVGKGVTFDSGGISIKPSAAMDEMKFDMCGAASVFGTLQAVVEMGLKTNVIGLIPATENLPDGLATKPGDIVTSMSGTTIEILNTDAEGRLILCDALTYAQRYKPAAVVDIATLTGACVVALGAHASGLFSQDDELTDELLEAGTYTGDRAWRMPLWDEYQEQLKSNFADIANVGGRDGGAVTAACFLARFAGAFRWAHLDIAGAAWHSGAKKGSTGRPVKLLSQYLLNRVSSH